MQEFKVWEIFATFDNRPEIHPFGKINFMDKKTKEQSDTFWENAKSQKETQREIFKQDARRTAIQLSERFSVDSAGNKPADIVIILANAEMVYQWLINLPEDGDTTLIDLFIKKGIIK